MKYFLERIQGYLLITSFLKAYKKFKLNKLLLIATYIKMPIAESCLKGTFHHAVSLKILKLIKIIMGFAYNKTMILLNKNKKLFYQLNNHSYLKMKCMDYK